MINLFKPRKKQNIHFEPSAPPYYEFYLINDKDLVCWWQTF